MGPEKGKKIFYRKNGKKDVQERKSLPPTGKIEQEKF